MPSLFDPVTLGSIHLPNRIVMAPLTRLRAGAPVHVPNPVMATYYAQRADAGLIVSEGVPVSPQGVGYQNVPGIWNAEQVAGWRAVTQAVHAAGGRIFAQLWHVGRISHPVHLGGDLPVAPSPIAAPGHVSLLLPQRPYVIPRSLETEEIAGIVEDFRSGAQNAKAAGFDGVTIHGANGYLLDQFLQDGTNHRTDAYGGRVEGRARLMLEVADAVVSVWGGDRVGMHLAPRSPSYGMSDSHPEITFPYVAAELGKRKLAFLFVRETRGPGALLDKLKTEFAGPVIANDGFDFASGTEVVARGEAAAVGFGRQFISNPDLVRRFRTGAPLNPLVSETIYGLRTASVEEGYTDYPTLAS